MKYLFLFLITFVCLFLSGCLRRADVANNQTILKNTALTTSIERALDNPEFEVGQWPKKEWWETFESEELNNLIEQALYNNPSIQAAQQRINVAKENAMKTKSPLFPLIFFNAEEEWAYVSKNGFVEHLNNHLGRSYNRVDLTLSFDYEFDFWAKYKNLYKAALGYEMVARAEQQQTVLIVSTALAQAYFALKTNLVRQKLYHELYDVRLEAFNLQVLIQEKGLTNMLVPAMSEIYLEETKKEVEAIDDEVLASYYLVNILRGATPDAELDIEVGLTPIPEVLALPENLSSEFLCRRPDLMAAICRVECLAFAVNAAIADYFPQIDLKGFIGLDSLGYKHLLDWASRDGALIPGIRLPIFEAGKIRANVRMKRAEFEESIYTYNDLLLKGLQEVADALIFLNLQYQLRASQNLILESALFRYNLSALRVEKGLDNLLEFYIKEEELIKRELEDIVIIYNQYLGSVKLIKSLGGGYSCEYNPLAFKPVQEAALNERDNE